MEANGIEKLMKTKINYKQILEQTPGPNTAEQKKTKRKIEAGHE